MEKPDEIAVKFLQENVHSNKVVNGYLAHSAVLTQLRLCEVGNNLSHLALFDYCHYQILSRAIGAKYGEKPEVVLTAKDIDISNFIVPPAFVALYPSQ